MAKNEVFQRSFRDEPESEGTEFETPLVPKMYGENGTNLL